MILLLFCLLLWIILFAQIIYIFSFVTDRLDKKKILHEANYIIVPKTVVLIHAYEKEGKAITNYFISFYFFYSRSINILHNRKSQRNTDLLTLSPPR